MASFKIENICACSLLKVLSFSVRRCSDSSRCAACCVSRYGVRMQRLRSWARLHVRLSRFACMLRLLSPAIVRKTRGRDCGQRLSRKGARPLSSALPHTVHQGIEATTPDETRVGNAKISTCTVVSISHFVGGPSTHTCCHRAPFIRLVFE